MVKSLEKLLNINIKKSSRVRYNQKENTIAIGKNRNGKFKVTTMFKPDEGELYYHDDYKRENNND